MHALALHHPSWYRALTLTERLASLRQDRQAARDVAVDAGRAERRLRRFANRVGLSGPSGIALLEIDYGILRIEKQVVV